MKKNSQGFMLAETLVVGTFISVILIYMFVQFRNINNNYGKTLKYNGVNEMYILEQINKYLKQNNIDKLSSDIVYGEVSHYILNDCDPSIFIDTNACQTLFNISEIKQAVYFNESNPLTSPDFSNSFNDYIKTIKKGDGLFVIAAEFNDGSFASIKVGGYNYLTLKESIESQNIVTIGNGLYYDASITENPIYVYKGNNINNLKNNIEILGYKGRIIFSDKDGVKVYLDLKENMLYNNDKSYFTSSNSLTSGNYLENSNSNSLLFSNLNTKAINSDYIKIGAKYGVGKIDNIVGNSLANIISSENSAIYEIRNLYNYIATINVSDIIRTSINASCNYENISNNCLLDNWLSNDLWTMNYKTNNKVWGITNNTFSDIELTNTNNAYMIVYIDPDVFVTGDGSNKHPFKIK